MEMPEGAKEEDLSFEKMLIAAHLDKYINQHVDEAVWTTVLTAMAEKSEEEYGLEESLIKLSRLMAAILLANYPEPLETLATLKAWESQ